MQWLIDRLREPSTASGLGLVATGVALATGGDEHAAQVGHAVETAAQAVGSADWSALIPAIIGGLVAVLAPERGRR